MYFQNRLFFFTKNIFAEKKIPGKKCLSEYMIGSLTKHNM